MPALPSLSSRLVRYQDLRPCTTAFIDARTPGSDRKENFTIIGPGVAESPDQYVHIEEPHGFNIGGARQPPRCVNSQHFHETAEVFFVHQGRWAFRSGEHADEGEVILEPGDVISIPTYIFRGFENVGEDVGFIFSVLGGDDPGRVTWAPHVLEAAKGHGLVLLESGRLLDAAKGERAPEGEAPVQPETREALARIVRHADSAAMERIVSRRDAPPALTPFSAPGVREAVLLGPANPSEDAPASALDWPHGFACRRLTFAPGAGIGAHRRATPEVLFLHQGALLVDVEGDVIELGPGDTFTTPVNAARAFRAGAEGAHVFVARGGDRPAPAVFV